MRGVETKGLFAFYVRALPRVPGGRGFGLLLFLLSSLMHALGHAALALGGGDFYGFAKDAAKGSRMRILKFDKSGKFLMAWGKEGTGAGEFNQRVVDTLVR